MDAHRMTVLQVLPALEGGGVERGVLEIAEALTAAGHRSLVVSAGGRMVRELTHHGSEHFTCPVGAKSPMTLRWVPWMRRLMVREGVDIVDIHSRLPGWITLLAWKSLPPALRPRLISTVHGLHSVSRYSGVMCSGEVVIVVSETVREYVRQNYPWVQESQLRLVHRGIDGSEYPRGFQPDVAWKRSFSGQFPLAAAQPLIMLPGRITRLKGHQDFLTMMARLRDSGVAGHGLIVGGAETSKAGYLEEIRQLIGQMGLQERITLTGHRADLKELYAISRVVVSLSQTPESFGRTVAEALSVGTPVVGYAHGGVAEILAAQFPSGAVPCGCITELADRVEQILSRRIPLVIGPNAFEKSDMLRKTLQVYTEVAHGSRRAAA